MADWGIRPASVAAAHTWVIEVGGAFAGCVSLRPAEDAHWLEHVLRGSAARRLYERYGFTVETEDPVDVFMVREPARGPRRDSSARP
ncbi:hypothetical protein [Phytohabitans rumicis]|uniref:N-acetyltransferase n=1 Tax=Phytohabitans rumicis TaxID=1076125 RepID=A0A6V8LFE3_9ACTN|nr:hypothetical protein [Phytohabitans rumicis]GFJ95982.1 N-acetyltransferase [Phytohabitans rumicis]